MQSAFDAVDLFAWRAAGLVHGIRHPARTRFILGAVKNQQRNLKIAQRAGRIECPSAEEMQRNARKCHARDRRKTAERRLQNEPVEWMCANHLGRDRAATEALTALELGARLAFTNIEGTPVPVEQLPAVIALQEHRPAHRWLDIIDPDGARQRVEATAFPVKSDGGEVVGAVALFWPAELF